MLHYWIFTLFFIESIEAVRITSISKSQSVIRYSELSMHCFFLLENDDRLYSLKWLLNDVEVLRYSPRSKPPLKINRQSSGFLIDESRSNGTFIYFHQIDFTAAGVWKCHVMLEAPSFESVEASTHLKVVVLPSDEPAIIKSHPSFQDSDVLTFTCVSCCSNPPAKLTWLLNDNAVAKEYLQSHPLIDLPDKTFNSSLGLRIRASQSHFRDGIMRVRCIANVSDGDYWKTSEIVVRWPGSKNEIKSFRFMSGNKGHNVHPETIGCLSLMVGTTQYLFKVLRQ